MVSSLRLGSREGPQARYPTSASFPFYTEKDWVQLALPRACGQWFSVVSHFPENKGQEFLNCGCVPGARAYVQALLPALFEVNDVHSSLSASARGASEWAGLAGSSPVCWEVGPGRCLSARRLKERDA